MPELKIGIFVPTLTEGGSNWHPISRMPAKSGSALYQKFENDYTSRNKKRWYASIAMSPKQYLLTGYSVNTVSRWQKFIENPYVVSIHDYSGVACFITDYVTGGYIFALYDRLINQPTSSSISSHTC
jgi:hypothetical protein